MQEELQSSMVLQEKLFYLSVIIKALPTQYTIIWS